MSDYTILASKSGVVTTDSNGLAQVVFREGFRNPTNYVVHLTCYDDGSAIYARPSNLSNTGFTITSYLINQPGGAGVKACVLTASPNEVVYWIAVISSN